MFGLNLHNILLRIPTILLAISVHELAHGYVAYRLGDPTAKQHGRLNLNPLAHFDIIGTLCMLLFGFGWAKPVPVNPMYFKNRKQGMSLVGLAGPLSNFLMALLFSVIYALCIALLGEPASGTLAEFAFALLDAGIVLNVRLGVFNLIPIPPLDGSKILAVVLPDKAYYKLMMYERYAVPILMLLLFTRVLDIPLQFFVSKIIEALIRLMTLIVGALV